MAADASGNFSTSFGDISSGLFGTDTSVEGSGTSTEKAFSRRSEQLKIDEAGLLQLIDKALKGVGGLSEIFGQEAGAGLFDSSSAKAGTEDLLAKIAGELALVTGKKTATDMGSKDVETTSKQQQESSGIMDAIGLGGLF